MPKRGRKKASAGTRSSKRKRTASPGDTIDIDESNSSVQVNEGNSSDVGDNLDETEELCSEALDTTTCHDTDEVRESVPSGETSDTMNNGNYSTRTLKSPIPDSDNLCELNYEDTAKDETKEMDLADDSKLKNNLEIKMNDADITNSNQENKPIDSLIQTNQASIESHIMKNLDDRDVDLNSGVPVKENTVNNAGVSESTESNEAPLPSETESGIKSEPHQAPIESVDKNSSNPVSPKGNADISDSNLNDKPENSSIDPNENKVSSSGDNATSVELNENELDEIKKKAEELAAQHELELRLKQEKEMEDLKAKQKAEAEALILKARKQKEEEELKIKKQKELELKIKKQRELEAARKAAELEALWKPVKSNPDDFNSWTKLLDYVETNKNIDNIRSVYDEFLSRYPYCYGYWRKYSELESEAGNVERCIMIFEKGLSSEGIELSVDLWIAYLDWAQANLQPGSNEDHMRDLYERSVKAAGLDFRSDKLWEHYINWESRGGRLGHVTALYDRLLTTPTQMYYQNWENFKRHIEENDPRAAIPESELKAVLESLAGENSENVSVSFLGSYQYKCTQKFIESREKASYQPTYESISERWNYEEKIRRPYFHIKPLENSQLTNWDEYLDFEISKGDQERVRVLFERCLIACAMYEYFWIKYARYLENTLCDLDSVRNVWKRACTVHLQKKPTVHWYWALFEERYPQASCSNKAVQILSDLEEALPNNMIVASRKIDCLRRSGAKPEDICSAFVSSIGRFKSKSLFPSASILTSKYARYLHKVIGNSDRAVKVLQEAIDGDQRNESLYRQLLDIAYQKQPMDVELFCQLAAIAIESSLLSPEAKLSISKRKLQVMEEFENDPNRLKEAYNEYESLCQASKSSEELVATSKNLTELLGLQSVDANLADSIDPTNYSAGFYDPLMQIGQSTASSYPEKNEMTESDAVDPSSTVTQAPNQEVIQPAADMTNVENNYYSQYQYQDSNYGSAWNPWNAYYTNYQNAQYSSWNTANSSSMVPHYSG